MASLLLPANRAKGQILIYLFRHINFLYLNINHLEPSLRYVSGPRRFTSTLKKDQVLNLHAKDLLFGYSSLYKKDDPGLVNSFNTIAILLTSLI